MRTPAPRVFVCAVPSHAGSELWGPEESLAQTAADPSRPSAEAGAAAVQPRVRQGATYPLAHAIANRRDLIMGRSTTIDSRYHEETHIEDHALHALGRSRREFSYRRQVEYIEQGDARATASIHMKRSIATVLF